VCMAKIRSAVGSSSRSGGTEGGSYNTRDQPAGASETDALLFNPIDEPGD
jgi:hypothetical protein